MGLYKVFHPICNISKYSSKTPKKYIIFIAVKFYVDLILPIRQSVSPISEKVGEIGFRTL